MTFAKGSDVSDLLNDVDQPRFEMFFRHAGMEDKFDEEDFSEMEQAFWHLWTLNCYHVTLSFDQNMVLLLDWAVQFHMDWSEE